MSEPAVRPSDLVKDTLPDQSASKPTTGSEALSDQGFEDQVYEAMKDVVDPELMINVVDLGLVYGMQVDAERNVTLDMTLTTPACPLTDQIEYGAREALDGIATSVTVNWVWLPPWSLDMINDDGREQLRYIGFNV